MKRRLPRLELVEDFIEAAHAPNFRTAAARRALSPAAFSRRIQSFTDFVGRDVFERTGGGIRLTEAGRECLATLEPAYRAMKQAANDVGAANGPGRVTVSLSHSLAVGWLIPRLSRFRERCPNIDVGIQMVRTAEAIRQGEADCGICAADVDVAGLQSEHLLSIRIGPVATPELAAAFHRDRAALREHALLGMRRHPDMWPYWLREAGSEFQCGETRHDFDVLHATYEAAVAGLGVAMGIDVTVRPHLASGRLVDIGLPWIDYPGGYRLVSTSTRLRSRAVRQLWAWLIEERKSEQAATVPA